MPPLQRNRLVGLSADAWSRWIDKAVDAHRPLLRHWLQQGWPLVVARPWMPQPAGLIALGLPAPARFGRLRVALTASHHEVMWVAGFPTLAEVSQAQGWTDGAALAHALSQQGLAAEVYGSWGWQHLTGERYVHADSDLDLRVALHDADQAGEVIDRLQAADLPLRLDGELVLPDGRAVAWREWAALREGRVAQVLVKSLQGLRLCDAAGLETAQRVPA